MENCTNTTYNDNTFKTQATRQSTPQHRALHTRQRRQTKNPHQSSSHTRLIPYNTHSRITRLLHFKTFTFNALTSRLQQLCTKSMPNIQNTRNITVRINPYFISHFKYHKTWKRKHVLRQTGLQKTQVMLISLVLLGATHFELNIGNTLQNTHCRQSVQ